VAAVASYNYFGMLCTLGFGWLLIVSSLSFRCLARSDGELMVSNPLDSCVLLPMCHCIYVFVAVAVHVLVHMWGCVFDASPFALGMCCCLCVCVIPAAFRPADP